MKPYPIEIRAAAVASVETGGCTVSEAADHFHVSKPSLERWLAQNRKVGHAQPRKAHPRLLACAESVIRAAVSSQPDITLHTLCEVVQGKPNIHCSESTMSRELLRLGLGTHVDRQSDLQGQLVLLPQTNRMQVVRIVPASAVFAENKPVTAHALRWVESLVDAGSVRAAANLTPLEMLAYINAAGQEYTMNDLNNFERDQQRTDAADRTRHPKYRRPTGIEVAYENVLRDAVHKASGGRIGIRSRLYQSHWRVSLCDHCQDCKREFVATQPRQAHCKRCQSKRKGN